MKKLIKKIWRAYLKANYEMYGEAWKKGVIPYNF